MGICGIGTMVGHRHSGFKAESMVGYDGSVIADLIRNPEGANTPYHSKQSEESTLSPQDDIVREVIRCRYERSRTD